MKVQTSFYASGFLYHRPSQKILLQQLTTEGQGVPFLFKTKAQKGNDPQAVFKLCVEKVLDKPIKSSSIHPVYDYIDERLGEQYIFFADVSDISPTTYPSNTKAEWFLLSKLSKIHMNEDTRHDILIGERVIRSLSEHSVVS